MEFMPVFKIDSATSFADMKPQIVEGEEGVMFSDNSKYKYLSAMQLCEDGSYIPMCSKDLKKWSICIGAVIDGKPVDVKELAKKIQMIMEGKS